MEPRLGRSKPDLSPGLGGARRGALGVLARLAGFGRAVRIAMGGGLTPERARSLLEALTDEHPAVREAAANALSGASWRDAALHSAVDAVDVNALADCLRDPLPTVREQAVMALGVLGQPVEVGGHLHDPEPSVRRAACWALGEIGASSAVPQLIEALADRDWTVYGAAVEALGRIGSPATRHLCRTLTTADERTRLGAAMALRQVADARAVPYLTDVLRQDASAEVRNMAVHALARIATEEALSGLEHALTDGENLYPGFEWAVRDTAAVALERLRDSP